MGIQPIPQYYTATLYFDLIDCLYSPIPVYTALYQILRHTQYYTCQSIQVYTALYDRLYIHIPIYTALYDSIQL